MSTPPVVGKTLSVKVDQALYDDLSTIMSTGMTQTEAVRLAMLVVAGTYRRAWETGRCPQDVRPTIERYWITRYDEGQKPGDPVPAQGVPQPYRHGPTPSPAGMTVRHTPHPTITPAGSTGHATHHTRLPRSE
jgi:hypothetical protein